MTRGRGKGEARPLSSSSWINPFIIRHQAWKLLSWLCIVLIINRCAGYSTVEGFCSIRLGVLSHHQQNTRWVALLNSAVSISILKQGYSFEYKKHCVAPLSYYLVTQVLNYSIYPINQVFHVHIRLQILKRYQNVVIAAVFRQICVSPLLLDSTKYCRW